METYILYRSENTLMGIVEDLLGRWETFSNPAELKDILTDSSKVKNPKQSIAMQSIMREKLRIYVLNIYRIEQGEHGDFAGMIRKANCWDRYAFSNCNELFELVTEN